MENLKITKIVKRWGSSLVIVLNKEDTKILNLKEGDILNLDIIKTESKDEGGNL